MNFKIIQDSEKFFDIKFRAQKIYSEILEGHSSKISFQSQFETCLSEMLKIAKDNKAIYYIERIKSIQSKFIDLQKSQFQSSIEAKRISSLFEKIDETESVYFLNSVLNNKLEKIARNYLNINASTNFKDHLVLRFQSSIIVVPSAKKKIIKNVEYTKKYISYNRNRIMIFPIFPIPYEISDYEYKKSNVLILQSGDRYRCVRFDSFLAEEKFDSLELEDRKIETFSQLEDLKYFLRWRGRNCFFLDFPDKVRDLPEAKNPSIPLA